MMSLSCFRPLLALCLAGVCTAALAADAFAPTGAKATLSVEYLYESSGKKQDEYDRHEWRVKRNVNLVAELTSQAATPLPTMQTLDATQTTELKSMADKGQAVAAQMAPMKASIETIMAKCGDDEACITRETQKMGFGMQGTPELATALKAQKDVQDLSKPGAPRYQAWRATAQKGTYAIEETLQFESTAMGAAVNYCAKLPKTLCTRNETRKGAGDAGGAGFSTVEVDTVKNTLTIVLPVPMQFLSYTETVKTNYLDPYYKDYPESSQYKPAGTTQKTHRFLVTADGKANHEKPFTVALKGGWRSQSGEQVVNLKGDFGDAGKLTVRWRFAVP